MPHPSATMSGMWHGYVEQHKIGGEGRKRAGAEYRRSKPSGVVLDSPDAVAEWMRASIAALSRDAGPDAAVKNHLMIRPANVHAATARKGGSVYATVHATRDEVWDVCAEIVS